MKIIILGAGQVGSTVAEAQARAKGQSAQWAALVKRIHLTND